MVTVSYPSRLYLSHRQTSLSSYAALDLDIPPMDGFDRFNEACVDPTGRRWMLGSVMHEGHPSYTNGGALYSIEGDDNNELTARLELDDGTVANGMGWSRDLKTMWAHPQL